MSTITQMVSLRMAQNMVGTGAVVRAPAQDSTTAASAPAPSTVVSLGATQSIATVVDYTDRIKASGDKTIDPLLAGGNRWWHTAGASGATPSASAKHALTYSFIGSASGLNATDATGFQALDATQKQVIRDALDYISSVVDITFTEVSSGGDIQYGSNTQASSAGYARYPNEGSQVFLANNQSSFSGSWAKGSYEWETIVHETGHALGLKHPGNYNAGGGGTPGPYLAKASDNRNNSIMSYNNNAGNMKRIAYSNNSFQTSYVNPDTFQLYDIAALQYLYGGAQNVAAQTYGWSDAPVMNQTIWNPTAGSGIDLSNQTKDSIVDLRAGKASSIGLRDAYGDMPFDKAGYAALTSGGKKLTSLLGVPTYTGAGNLTIARGSRIDHATGGSGNDTFVTNTEDNVIDGGAGNDAVFVTGGDAEVTGGNGDDTVYVVKKSGTTWAISQDGSTLTQTKYDKKTNTTTTLATISLAGVEHVKYWNGTAFKAAGAALYGMPAPAPSPNVSTTA